MAGKTCVHCGKEHDERTKFCPNTGKGLAAAASPAPAPTTPRLPLDPTATLPDGIPSLALAEAIAAAAEADGAARSTRMMFVPKEAGGLGGPGVSSGKPSPDTPGEGGFAKLRADPPPSARPTVTARPAAGGGSPPARSTPPPRGTTPALGTPPARIATPPLGITPARQDKADDKNPALLKTQLGGITPVPPAGAAPMTARPAPSDDKKPALLKTQLGGIGPLPPAAADEPAARAPAARAAPARDPISVARQRATAAGMVTGSDTIVSPTIPNPHEPLPPEAATIVTPALGAYETPPRTDTAKPPSRTDAPKAPPRIDDRKTPPRTDTPKIAPRAETAKASPVARPSAPMPETVLASTLPPARTSSKSHPAKTRSAPSWAVSPEDGVDGEGRIASDEFVAAGPASAFFKLLRKTGGFYLANAGSLLLIAAVVIGPVAVLTSLLMAGLGSTGALVGPARLVLSFLVNLLMKGVAWPLTAGALTIAVLDRSQGGKIRPLRYLRFAGRRIGPLVTALVPAAFITAIGYFLFVIPGLIASLLLAFVPTVVLLEGQQGAEALKRSFNLVKELFVPTLIVMTLFMVLSVLLHSAVTMLVPGWGVLDYVASDLSLIVLAPLPMIALAFLYFDFRRTHEGLTREALAQELGGLEGHEGPDDDPI